MSSEAAEPRAELYTAEQIAGYKRDNERRVREAALRGDVFVDGMPLKVTLELTADCDFFCRMCEFPIPREAGRKKGYALSNSEEEFEMLAPQVLPSAMMVNLTVVGEPLMVPYLDRVVEQCGDWQTKIEFITHGQHLDQAMIEKVGPHTATMIISFDGGTRRTFNRIRVGGDFNVITRNALLFNRWRQALPDDADKPGFHLSSCLMKENIHELPTIIRVAHALGIDKVNMALMIAFNEKIAKSSLFRHKAVANAWFRKGEEVAKELGMPVQIPAEFPGVPEEEIAAIDTTETLITPEQVLPHLAESLGGGAVPDLEAEPAAPDESFHELGANIPLASEGGLSVPLPGQDEPEAAAEDATPPTKQSADEKRLQAQTVANMAAESPRSLGAPLPAEPPPEEGRYTCKFLWNELFVNVSGDVAPCCIQGRPVVGNVNKEPLSEIWNGPMMTEMRQRLLDGDPVDCCRDCNYNTQLGQGTYREDTFFLDKTQRKFEL